MSYVKLNPSYYQMLQPESAWHPGAEGWSVAPYPGWGQNPNLVGPARLGVEGLGLNVSVSDGAACDCTHDKALGALGGAVFGGITAGLIVYLMGK